jgi:hypothetical protein
MSKLESPRSGGMTVARPFQGRGWVAARRLVALATNESGARPPASPISEIRVAIPRVNLHPYQNIEKKWSLVLDKILIL